MLAALVAVAVANLAADLPHYESNLREKAQNLKLATSGSYTLQRAANVLHDLQSELETERPVPALPDGQAAPACHTIWESSRFGVDLCTSHAKSAGSIAKATCDLFAGMIEFGLMRQLTDIVTVTDARMERILCRARWPLRRLGSPRPIGKTIAVAGHLEVSRERLQCVREAGGLGGPVIDVAGGRVGRFPRGETMETAVV
jgi:hypothetical protein